MQFTPKLARLVWQQLIVHKLRHQMMPLFALFVLAFVDLTSGVTVIPKSKKGIVIVVMRLSESSKKLVRLSLL